MGTSQSWLRAAGAQRLKPPENDNRVTVCLPLGPSRGGWNLGPIYEEILEDEPTLAAIERTATATAYKLATGRRGRRRGLRLFIIATFACLDPVAALPA